MLLDEPFSALDIHTRYIIQEELISVWQQTRKTVLFVTHSPEEAYLLSDKVVLMSNRPGRVCNEFIIDDARPRNIVSSEAQKFILEVKHTLRNEVERGAHQVS